MPDGTTAALAVQRAMATTEPAHLLAVIFQNPADRVDDAAVGTDEWVQQYAIVVYVVPLEGDQTPVDSYSNAAFGAISKALMADPYRGGLALNTVVQAPLFFPAVAGEFAGLTFNFDVQYRAAIDDPFTPAT